MKRYVKEQEVLEAAVERFRETTGIPLEVFDVHKNDPADAMIYLDYHGINHKFATYVKTGITTTTIGKAFMHLRHIPEKALLVTDYMNPNLADRDDEQELVELAKRDRAAFARLYRMYYPLVAGHVYRRIGDRHATEDLVAEVFL